MRNRKNKAIKVNKKNIIVVIGILVIISGVYIASLTGVIPLSQRNEEPKVLSAEDEKMLERLREIIDVPKEITPLIATVNDPEILKKQQPGFFSKAKKGDRVIVYPDFAILYDEKENKILHFGPVNFGDVTQPGNEVLTPVTFAIYNGSGKTEKALAYEEILRSTFNNIAIVRIDPAAKIYKKTAIIDLVGNNPEIETIASRLGAEITTLPEGETKPDNTMVLVIVGTDFEG